MSIESFYYNNKELGCIDVDVVRKKCPKTEKYVINANVIFFRDEDEYFITLSNLKEEGLNYEILKDKINNIIRKQIKTATT